MERNQAAEAQVLRDLRVLCVLRSLFEIENYV